MSAPDDRPFGLPPQPYRRPRRGWPAGLALLLVVVAGVGFIWAYLDDRSISWLGGFLTLGLAGIGFALAYWGRDLTDDTPQAEAYPLPPADPQPREELGEAIHEDAKVLTRRRFLTAALVGAAGVFGLSQHFLVGSLGPRPGARASTPSGAPAAAW